MLTTAYTLNRQTDRQTSITALFLRVNTINALVNHLNG